MSEVAAVATDMCFIALCRSVVLREMFASCRACAGGSCVCPDVLSMIAFVRGVLWIGLLRVVVD